MKAKDREPTPLQDGDENKEGYILKPEVAARLRKTERTVEDWMRRGIIPYIKIGKGRRATVLFLWDDIKSHLQEKFGMATRN